MKTEFPTTPTVSPAQIRDAPRRLEGHAKVLGQAQYVGDFHHPEAGGPLDVAVAVTSTQATGRVLAIEATAALALPGVRLVVSHENAPRLHAVTSLTGTEIGDLLPLQDDKLHYYGQCVAVVVADTLEHAQAAAALVLVRYSAPAPDPAFTLTQGQARVKDAKKVGGGDPGQVSIGHPEKAYAAAPHQVDATFTTPPHHHNAMEPGGALAHWTADGGLTVQVPTQFSYGESLMLAQAFGFGLKDRLPGFAAEALGLGSFGHQVRVISPLIGGSFGGKTGNVHLLLAAMAAKLAGRAVRLVLTRAQTFSLLPFRPETWQRVRLAADGEGRLQAVLHDTVAARGVGGEYVEPIGELTAKLYAAPNVLVHQQEAMLDTNAPGWMRAPGACVGQFAVESALDMLAHQLGLDPLDLRLRNHADREPDTGKEWSSKSLIACYQAAAARIGWADRNPRVGSMREGGRLIGYGMATAMYLTKQMPASARVILHPDGRAVVQTAAHEMGQGMITALTQIAAEALGLPLAAVHLDWGDTRLPYGGMSVGSMTTLANGSAIVEAAEAAKKALLKRVVADKNSPLHGQAVKELRVLDGRITAPDGTGETVGAALARHPTDPISEEATTGRTFGRSDYGRAAFGAQFAQVSIDPDTRHLCVERLVGAFAGGRLINPRTVRSQLLGGMVWGVGQALMEESTLDPRTGHWLNDNLGEALVPTNADIAGLEAIMIEEDDSRGSALGVKGLAEIGSVGTAAAIANAVFHATGQRLTSLPLRIDKLL